MRTGILTALLLSPVFIFSQTDTSRQKNPCKPEKFFDNAPCFNHARANLVTGGKFLVAGGSLAVLGSTWYSDYSSTKFHSFNDNAEWLQMDKVGHLVTAYTVGRYGIGLIRWSGADEKQAIWRGGLLGFEYLAVVEIMDGFSTGWGFSAGDMIANTAGTALLISQELIWHEQRIVPKFGFQRSEYAIYRPSLLGKNFGEQMLKDYNGQTYWLSFNIASFLPAGNQIPPWLNLAFGYGASGMTGGHENPPYYNATGNLVTFDRYRQFYIAPDIDLTKIPVKSPVLKTIFNTFGFLKIPAPGIEISKGKISTTLFAF
jgi:hypothetical protein